MQLDRRRDLSLFSGDNDPRTPYRSTCAKSRRIQREAIHQANTFGPAGRVRGARSYLDNGYRIDERRTGDSSRIKEEKGDENHRENHQAAESDLEIREDSNGEELADCKLYSPARRDCGKIGRADEIIIVRVPSSVLSLSLCARVQREGRRREED